ncbi:hypothetical protein PG994_014281 [Apiospora phragmitis]|uniref:Uncharacterized protein n=1 Tax=Apiospora phragmitis TaxID=2905665 RepID=A0ABR1T3V6_9PEZI
MSLAERPHTLRGKEMPYDTSLCNIEKSASTERTCSTYSAKSSAYDEPILDDYVEMDETSLIEQATVKMVQKKAMDANIPQLPRKSSRRASRLLLSDFKINTADPNQTLINTPHDVYLSSEEDASSSAGDFSDYDYDSSSEASQVSPVGADKPRRHGTRGVGRLLWEAVHSELDRSQEGRISGIRYKQQAANKPVGSTPYTLHYFQEQQLLLSGLGPRSRSGSTTFTRRSSLYSTDSASRRTLSFLSIDPFASKDYSLERKDTSETNAPRTPRTPTAMFNRVQQSLGLHRRRSRPMLHETNSKATSSRESFFSLRTSSTLGLNTNVSPERQSVSDKSEAIVSPQNTSPRRYSTAWKKIAPSGNSQPMSPLSPAAAKKALLGSLHLNKRKSLRL